MRLRPMPFDDILCVKLHQKWVGQKIDLVGLQGRNNRYYYYVVSVHEEFGYIEFGGKVVSKDDNLVVQEKDTYYLMEDGRIYRDPHPGLVTFRSVEVLTDEPQTEEVLIEF